MMRLILTLELLNKELRLQKNNTLFSLVVVFIGVGALLIIKETGPEISSFSANDIRTAFFMTVIVPALVVILPLMTGSTAAAGEKTLGVLAWQSALPVSWRLVVAIKATAVAVVCVVMAGAFPYLLQLLMPPDANALARIFRDTWPGWSGLLCGAVGFYAGALARDDYQGLLISVVPLGLLFFLAWFVDPFLLVMPVSWGGPIWKEWALALRLMVIAGLLVALTAQLLKRSGQPRRWQIVRHTIMLAPLVFILTLWNLVTEGSMLKVVGGSKPTNERITSINNTDLQIALPTEIASLPDRNLALGFLSHIDFSNTPKVASETMEFGQVVRRHYWERDSTDSKSRHYFLIDNAGELREFPSASGTLKGYTRNGRWLWTEAAGVVDVISGPFGITITTWTLPDVLYNLLIGQMKFEQPLPENAVYELTDPAISTVAQPLDYRTRAVSGPISASATYDLNAIRVESSNTRTSDAAIRLWELPKNRSMNGGTTVTLFPFYGFLPTLQTGGENYTWFQYLKFGPVMLGGEVVSDRFIYESGVEILNLESGKQTMVPIPLPWPAGETLNLQRHRGEFPTGTSFGFRQFIWDQSSGRLAVGLGDYLAFVSLKDDEWKDGVVDVNYGYVPRFTQGQFMNVRKFLATDGQKLWVVPVLR